MSRLVKVYNYILNHPRTRRGYWSEWYYSERYDRALYPWLNSIRICEVSWKSDVEKACTQNFFRNSDQIVAVSVFILKMLLSLRKKHSRILTRTTQSPTLPSFLYAIIRRIQSCAAKFWSTLTHPVRCFHPSEVFAYGRDNYSSYRISVNEIENNAP
jgi:predicted AlkP superfamily pyrophosphatase or phosphodiesterase